MCNLYCNLPCKHGNNGAAPLSSDTCHNMMSTRDSAAKKYLRVAGVSACRFDAMAKKKNK